MQELEKDKAKFGEKQNKKAAKKTSGEDEHTSSPAAPPTNMEVDEPVIIKKEAGCLVSQTGSSSTPSAPAEAPAGAAHDGGGSIVEAPPVSNMAVGHDITQMTAPIMDDLPEECEESIQTRFLKAGVVVPGIALKKLKMVLEKDLRPNSTVIAILGLGHIKKYKKSRPVLQNMVVGDLENTSFWQKVAEHLKDKRIGAMMFPCTTPFTMEQVSRWLALVLLFSAFQILCLRTLTDALVVFILNLNLDPLVKKGLSCIFWFYRCLSPTPPLSYWKNF